MIFVAVAVLSFLFAQLNLFFKSTLTHIDSLVGEDQMWSARGRQLSQHLTQIATDNGDIQKLANNCMANPSEIPVLLPVVRTVVARRNVHEFSFRQEVIQTPNAVGGEWVLNPIVACGLPTSILAPTSAPFLKADRPQSGMAILWTHAFDSANWRFSNAQVRPL